MDIDWSKAPEGATHYRFEGGPFIGGFYMHTGGEWFFHVDYAWEKLESPDINENYPLLCRPTKPQEWEGLEPMPCELDDGHPIRRLGELGNQAHNLGCELQNDEDLSDELSAVAVKLWDLEKQLRLKSQQERQSEELEKLVRDAYLDGASAHVGGLNAVVSAILSKYNLEPKP